MADISAIALTVAIPLLMQQREHSRLLSQNESLRKRVEELSQLAGGNERLNKVAADGANLALN